MRSTLRSGFTLVELLVTLAIVALIMTALLATLQTTLKTHDDIAIDLAAVRDGPRILDMIERDLRGLHVYNVKDSQVLAGKTERPSGLRGDRIDFITVIDSQRRIADPNAKGDDTLGIASDINEVGYRLRPCADSADFLELWRREDLFVDDAPFEGGTYEKINDRVHRFEITYLDTLGQKSEQITDWDMKDKKHLPAAIQIDLEIQCAPEVIGGLVETKADERRLYHFRRVIPFPTEETTALNVQPAMPIKITARQAGMNGGGGGKGGGAGGMLGGVGGAAGMIGGIGQDQGGGHDGKDSKGDPVGKTLDPNNAHPFWNLDPMMSHNSKFQLATGSTGSLSPGDEQKIDDFMNDYRNRFNPTGGGGTGGSSLGSRRGRRITGGGMSGSGN